jgi:broad specificity polyphosphatase/5'/3'-nucleotidase SurE
LIGGDASGGVAEPGNDFCALAHHCVSITPLSLDLTDRSKLATIEAWDLKL